MIVAEQLRTYVRTYSDIDTTLIVIYIYVIIIPKSLESKQVSLHETCLNSLKYKHNDDV